MSLTTDQARLITQSYALVLECPRRYSELFYHRLFIQHPFARALFPDDITHQIAVFAKTIDALIVNVSTLDRLGPTLADLAVRHAKYGVQPYHYEMVGTVLINIFEELLGIAFTPEVRTAWEVLYLQTAVVMIDKAYPNANLA
ncbi:globin domain-containing protein [Sphingomonas sp. Leaf339]|uniref:globin domain-containing protein n=1 Tax=Sphingomonas sp. Leaf339 TaxID=1736343 RepID=UPI0009EA6F91|nr:globin domain-containing protein [Sphingomonas sp. Leaf339]